MAKKRKEAKKAIKIGKKHIKEANCYALLFAYVPSMGDVVPPDLKNARFRLHFIFPACETVSNQGRVRVRLIASQIRRRKGRLKKLPSKVHAKLSKLCPSVTEQLDSEKWIAEFGRHGVYHKCPDGNTFLRRGLSVATSLLVRKSGLSLNALLADKRLERGSKIKSNELAEMIQNHIGHRVNISSKVVNGIVMLHEVKVLLNLDFEIIDHTATQGLDNTELFL